MSKPTDVRPVRAALYFLPVQTRVPLKFGKEVVTRVICARVKLTVRSRDGREAEGWGETPLSVTWVWPSAMTFDARQDVLMDFTRQLTKAWAEFSETGHPLEVGHEFQKQVLAKLHREFNAARAAAGAEPMPWLAALVCCSLFDIALHDAYGHAVGKPVYDTYQPEFMNRDLSTYLEPASASVSFAGKYPRDFFKLPAPKQMPVWHLVGGVDPIAPEELTGNEPKDGYPVLLRDWIRRDGLRCLKIKLRGNDAAWDYARTVAIGKMAAEENVPWLTADFNCTVTDPGYVNAILDRLRDEHPDIYGRILYVEQPFPYELHEHPIDVHSVSARKPLFMDESAHDWEVVKFGRTLGWTGVALKTCKTQTGALLSACWATAHGMTLMVQDLTNPMLAQIPHVQLAAHVGTIMGVESNGMQFYPEASLIEAKVHPGLYQRRNGVLDLSTLSGPGFGYRVHDIARELPEAAVIAG